MCPTHSGPYPPPAIRLTPFLNGIIYYTIFPRRVRMKLPLSAPHPVISGPDGV
jgi:hypothetical protein